MEKHKELLRERRNVLLKNLEDIKDSSKPVNLNDPIGRLSRMDAIQQQQIVLNTKRQIEINLVLVEQAIERLNRGEYGTCLSCEQEIEEKRLIAKPEAPFCMKCQR